MTPVRLTQRDFLILALELVTLSLVLQIKCIQFHPMQPWLGSVDEAGAVSVWNLSTRQQIYETKLSTPDDVTAEDFMLQQAAEKEKDFFGAHSSKVRFSHFIWLGRSSVIMELTFAVVASKISATSECTTIVLETHHSMP
jgi:WD40 repeat protein